MTIIKENIIKKNIHSVLFSLLFAGLVFSMSACQLSPTRVYEKNTDDIKSSGVRKIVISDSTIVIDARAPFKYSMYHMENAINLDWSEFSQSKLKGLLKKDLYHVTRRLARLGITIDGHVVVVGEGKNGKGEEGRIAWVLKYLGIKNVQFANIDSFKAKLTREPNKPSNVPVWRPNVYHAIYTSKSSLKRSLKKENVTLLDVRSGKEYLKGHIKSYGRSQTLNVNWKEFFNNSGYVNKDIGRRLSLVGVKKNKKIVVISNQGVRSSSVVLALRQLGFKKVSNYSGGMKDWNRR